MRKRTIIGLLFLFGWIMAFLLEANGAENKKARELGEAELGKYLIKCGQSWFVKRRSTSGFDQWSVFLYELKEKVNISLRELPLSEIDKLNGYEYKGTFSASYRGPQRAYGKNDIWGDWFLGSLQFEIPISKKNDNWSAIYDPDPYQQINCDDVPSELNVRKLLERVLNSISKLKRAKGMAIYNVSSLADGAKLILRSARNMATTINLGDQSLFLSISVADEALDMVRRDYSVGETELGALDRAERALYEYLQKNKDARISVPGMKTDIEASGKLVANAKQVSFSPLMEFTPDGKIFLDSRRITLENLQSELEIKAKTGANRLYIKADPNITYGNIVNAINIVKHATITELGIIDDKDTGKTILIKIPKFPIVEVPEGIQGDIVLTIRRDRGTLINQDKIMPDDLGELLKSLYEIRKDKHVFIRADAGLSLGNIIGLIPNINSAGVDTISIIPEYFTEALSASESAEDVSKNDKEKTKDMFVSPNFIGKIGQEIQLEEIEVVPWKIRIIGPPNIVASHYKATTSPVDLKLLASQKKVDVDIILPSPKLRFATSQTKAQIRINSAKANARNKEPNLDSDSPVRAVGNIRPPRLIRKVDPIYPKNAGNSGVNGVVILEATTDIRGKVQDIRVLRSIPLLDQAAIDAVRQWEYEPMIIDGKPRGVIFTVTVRIQQK